MSGGARLRGRPALHPGGQAPALGAARRRTCASCRSTSTAIRSPRPWGAPASRRASARSRSGRASSPISTGGRRRDPALGERGRRRGQRARVHVRAPGRARRQRTVRGRRAVGGVGARRGRAVRVRPRARGRSPATSPSAAGVWLEDRSTTELLARTACRRARAGLLPARPRRGSSPALTLSADPPEHETTTHRHHRGRRRGRSGRDRRGRGHEPQRRRQAARAGGARRRGQAARDRRRQAAGGARGGRGRPARRRREGRPLTQGRPTGSSSAARSRAACSAAPAWADPHGPGFGRFGHSAPALARSGTSSRRRPRPSGSARSS